MTETTAETTAETTTGPALARRWAAAPNGMSCYSVRPCAAPRGSVIVLPELFGLSPHVLAVCDRLAAAGAEVVCPDLLHRTPGATVLPETEAGRRAGFAALAPLSPGELIADVAGALALLSRPAAECGLLGLSVGGYVGFLAAARLGLGPVALAYPGWLTSGAPPIATDVPALGGIDRIAGPLLIVVGGGDGLIPPAEREAIRLALRAGRDDLLVLPGVGHGFLAPGRASHDDAAADAVWERIRAHLLPGAPHGLG